MAYGGGMGYHLHMPSYFWRTFTEYPLMGLHQNIHFDTAPFFRDIIKNSIETHPRTSFAHLP